MRQPWNSLSCKALLATALLAGLAALTGGCAGSARGPASRPAIGQTAGGLVEFRSEKGKLTTRFPASWQPRAGNETLDLSPVHDDSGGHRAVSIDVPDIPWHLPGMITLERVRDGYLDDLRKHFANVKAISSTDWPMPDAKAMLLQGTATEQASGKEMRIYTVLAIRHERVYIIAGETDVAGAEAGKKAVETILGSWRWEN